VKAPATVETERLLLRRPHLDDATAVFERYASDPDVTRYLGWQRHESMADTSAFLAFSDAEWERWPAGPYLVFSRRDGTLLGSSGLMFVAPDHAATGYVLAKEAWGHGYATETLHAVVGIASRVGVRRLHALCHPDHAASRRVLEKCGFGRRGTQPVQFPNLEPGVKVGALSYETLLRG
jgi:RimJ/RimL family protein N-acetyltransferase